MKQRVLYKHKVINAKEEASEPGYRFPVTLVYLLPQNIKQDQNETANNGHYFMNKVDTKSIPFSKPIIYSRRQKV